MNAAPEWQAWCDGSSLDNPGPAAWAIYVRRPDGTAFTRHGSSRKRTNNEAELVALTRALQAIPDDCPAVIHSDSEYAIKCATVWRANWQARGMKTAARKPVANAAMIERLWTASDTRPLVRLQWVRGHAGEEGNERVDDLARSAAEAVRAGGNPVPEITAEVRH
jgi:ribonuclease HI